MRRNSRLLLKPAPICRQSRRQVEGIPIEFALSSDRRRDRVASVRVRIGSSLEVKLFPLLWLGSCRRLAFQLDQKYRRRSGRESPTRANSIVNQRSILHTRSRNRTISREDAAHRTTFRALYRIQWATRLL